jgi:amidophosphoribosyltransferase
MGGYFGVASKGDCSLDLFYGTDYHSHLGTYAGGLAVLKDGKFLRDIHGIANSPFRTEFGNDILRMKGSNQGIGVISDTDPQPLLIGSKHGDYAIVTVGRVNNLKEIVNEAQSANVHFLEGNEGDRNPTEAIGYLIDTGKDLEDGIKIAQERVEGSCSMLVMTKKGIYAARDRLGRTPIVLGKKDGAYAATFETGAFPNLDFEVERDLGPGEVVLITPEGIEQKQKPREAMQICSFLWVYYGYPSSDYEKINVEEVRNNCGRFLARRDKEKGLQIDLIAGIPDSGTPHAIGYANEAKIDYGRPYVKYTPTWPRSFMPQDLDMKKLVAKMKLHPIKAKISGKRLLFCEDSIVRGVQLEDVIEKLYELGATEVHMRPACPPLIYGCKFINFSRSKSVLELASRTAIKALEGSEHPESKTLEEYANPNSEKHKVMVDRIRSRLRLTTLKYQKLPDLVSAIGLPKEKLCTFCWDGCEGCGK